MGVLQRSLKRLQTEEVVGWSLESDCESLNRLACAFLPRDAAFDGEHELNPFGNTHLIPPPPRILSRLSTSRSSFALSCGIFERLAEYIHHGIVF